MATTIPELVPISKMRQMQNKILVKLNEAPVVLTQHGEAAAVLVDPDQWNRLMEELEDLHDALDALEAKLALATGEEEVLDWEEVKATLDAVSTAGD